MIKYLALITLISILLVLPAARSRAAWLGALAGCIFIAWHRYNVTQLFKRRSHQTLKLFKHTVKVRNSALAASLAIILVVGSITLYHYKKDSADGRILIWTVTSNMIKDYPLLGVGQDMFKAHYMDYQADYFRIHPGSKFETVADDNQYAFNEFLNTWAEHGVIGFLLVICLVLVVFFGSLWGNKKFQVSGFRLRSGQLNRQVRNWNTIRQSEPNNSNFDGEAQPVTGNLKPKITFESLTANLNRSEAIHDELRDDEAQPESEQSGDRRSQTCNLQPEIIIKSSLLAVIVFGLFAYPNEILPIKLIAIICVALLAGMTLPVNTRRVKSFVPFVKITLSPLWLKCPLFITTVLALVLLLPQVKQLQHAYTTWKDGFDLYSYGLYTECLEDYQKALPLLQQNGEYLINYGKALSIAEKHKETIEILGKEKKCQNNTVLCTAMGDSHKALKQFADAEKNYWMASEMAPGKFYAQYLLAKLYDETGQHQKAIDMATALLKKEVKVESTAIEEIHDEMEQIIERNTVGDSQLLHNRENTTNGKKAGITTHLSKRQQLLPCPQLLPLTKASPEVELIKKKGGEVTKMVK